MSDDIPTLRRILAENRVVAMVGLSASWHRPSYFAAKYLVGKNKRSWALKFNTLAKVRNPLAHNRAE